jgi:hypothetical protein
MLQVSVQFIVKFVPFEFGQALSDLGHCRANFSMCFHLWIKCRTTKNAAAARASTIQSELLLEEGCSTTVSPGAEVAATGEFAPCDVAAVAVGVTVVLVDGVSAAVFPLPKMNVVAASSNGSVVLALLLATEASIGSILTPS